MLMLKQWIQATLSAFSPTWTGNVANGTHALTMKDIGNG